MNDLMTEEPTACPKCGGELEKREGMFFLHEVGSMPGLVCVPCNALWDSNEWIAALKARMDKGE